MGWQVGESYNVTKNSSEHSLQYNANHLYEPGHLSTGHTQNLRALRNLQIHEKQHTYDQAQFKSHTLFDLVMITDQPVLQDHGLKKTFGDIDQSRLDWNQFNSLSDTGYSFIIMSNYNFQNNLLVKYSDIWQTNEFQPLLRGWSRGCNSNILNRQPERCLILKVFLKKEKQLK